MKTLVIHPTDITTAFLSEIYLDKDWTIINSNISKKVLKEQIKYHDRIIMLGHGTEHGLLGFNRFIIDSNYVYLLREKICVYIWCNADLFVNKYGLNGLYTGMIISEYDEALLYSITTTTQCIYESNRIFTLAIKNTIDDEDMLVKIKSQYDGNSSVIEFNRNNIYYK